MSPLRFCKLILSVTALCGLLVATANAHSVSRAGFDATASAFHPAKVNIPVRDPVPLRAPRCSSIDSAR